MFPMSTHVRRMDHVDSGFLSEMPEHVRRVVPNLPWRPDGVVFAGYGMRTVSDRGGGLRVFVARPVGKGRDARGARGCGDRRGHADAERGRCVYACDAADRA